MISRWARTWMPRFARPLTLFFISVGITPNGMTAAGLALAILAGYLIANGWLPLAALLILVIGLCDALDGEIARQSQQETPLGAFLDSVADHYGDFAIYLGILWQALNQNGGNKITILLVFFAMFGSLVGSHIRSRAGMVGIETKNVGMFTRAERILVLFFGLVSGWVIPALVVLVIANNLSAIQRVIYTVFAARSQARPTTPGHPHTLAE